MGLGGVCQVGGDDEQKPVGGGRSEAPNTVLVQLPSEPLDKGWCLYSPMSAPVGRCDSEAVPEQRKCGQQEAVESAALAPGRAASPECSDACHLPFILRSDPGRLTGTLRDGKECSAVLSVRQDVDSSLTPRVYQMLRTFHLQEALSLFRRFDTKGMGYIDHNKFAEALIAWDRRIQNNIR